MAIFFGIDEDTVELAIEPVHVTPGDAFEVAVLGEDSDVLRKIGVVNPAGLQIEHLGSEQRGQANRAWGADDDLGKLFALDIIQHLEDGREAQLLQLVFR